MIGNQRQIVSWAFGSSTEIGNFKRFDLEGSYVVASLSGKTAKGQHGWKNSIPAISPDTLRQEK